MKLSNVARVLRSKNAGPLALTIDIIFQDRDGYDMAADGRALTRTAISNLYGLPEDQVELSLVPLALAIKVTMPRPIIAGSPGDRDVYGAQQHRPLLDLEL